MKVLVTGAAGFIGAHTCKTLLSHDHQVVGVDNINEYYDTDLKNYRLRSLLDDKNFSFEQFDLSERSKTESFFQNSSFDVVLHLAAQAGVRYSIDHPHSYTQNNIEAFLNILEGCRHGRIPKLCYASSSSVYGGIKENPFYENMVVDTPISLYAATKKANELMAHTYAHLYGIQTVGLRFFTVYGPMGRPDMAMWLFTDAILNERPIKVFNNGNMERSFTYIDDIVSGVVKSIECTLQEKYSIYNLGNDRVENVNQMITFLEDSLGKKAIRENLPIQPGDVPGTYADVSKARSVLDYSPQTPLEQGSVQFTKWFVEDWLPFKNKK